MAALAVGQGAKAAQVAERPTAQTLRAAAAAARAAVVDVDVARAEQPPWRGPGDFGPVPPIPIPPEPGEEDEGPREWRFEFRMPPDDQLRRFFRRLPRGPMAFPGGPGECVGVIVEVEGERARIAVPAELVGGAREATVALHDGRELEAEVRGHDEATGIGCLEVRAPDLQAIQIADPKTVKPGEWVLAIGGPRTGGALAIGIVSATDRTARGERAGTKVLLADIRVPIELVGAPLVNLRGELVGTVLAPEPGPAQWGFTQALPPDVLRPTLEALAREGRVPRGWLGVSIAPLTEDVRARLDVDHGILVQQVFEGEPAHDAGIRGGDVILEFAGQKVEDVPAFVAMVRATKPGQRLAVRLLRGEQQLEVEVAVGEREGEGLPPQAGPPALGGGERLPIGLTVQRLTPELARHFGLEDTPKGLLITGVDPGGPTARVRPPLRRGQAITEVARKPVATAAEARELIDQAIEKKEESILLLVRSAEGARYVVVDLPR
ncbi:MAG: PDZ domain-containing protein [Candidatus Brocadiia bacterium]